MNEAELRAKATRWAEADPDAASRAEIAALLGEKDLSKTDLADRFAGSLEFGTAGLRGVIGAGPNRMNRAVVLRTTHGLATEVTRAVKDAKTRGVVVGYDGRRLSREFAEDTACVLAAAGVRAHLFKGVAPTPLTAFAVHHLHAAAGVMVTASHNPPEYNGYKAYWENSAQIISPIDVAIANAIDAAPDAKSVPRMDMAEARAKELVVDVEDAVTRAYEDGIHALLVTGTKGGDREISIVYTAMHGVGNAIALRVLAEAGFAHVVTVKEQAEPDGRFPTVAFPNPEEKGAMDLAFENARREKAHLVLANDPDADRLAVAIPGKNPGEYVQLTGNQVGVVLGHWVLTRGPASRDPKKFVAIASIVSSPMLGTIARDLGVHYEETLTGFKWIANRAMARKAEDAVAFAFGYEEALGYTVGELVRDKDGISAATLFAEMTAVLRAEGRSVHEELEALYRKYGLFTSTQVNVVRKGADGAAQIRAMMEKLRANPPKAIAGLNVTEVSDYQASTALSSDGKTRALILPKSNVLTFALAGGHRVIARPSGTEPKAKFYIDVREPIDGSESLEVAETRAKALMAKLGSEFTELAK